VPSAENGWNGWFLPENTIIHILAPGFDEASMDVLREEYPTWTKLADRLGTGRAAYPSQSVGIGAKLKKLMKRPGGYSLNINKMTYRQRTLQRGGLLQYAGAADDTLKAVIKPDFDVGEIRESAVLYYDDGKEEALYTLASSL
jgi:hypothetical protein